MADENNNRQEDIAAPLRDDAPVPLRDEIVALSANNNRNENRKQICTSSDLHEAILANSYPVVQLYLEQGVNPNRSPQLAPIGVITNTAQEQARDLHRTLGRVFRSRREGTITPLIVAVCNAYHHSTSGKNDALNIIRALLGAGADTQATCLGIAFCLIGSHPSISIASAKTAAKVALFLKRFPVVNSEESCCAMMDSVATMILEKERKNSSGEALFEQKPSAGTKGPTSCRATADLWKRAVENDESFSDIVFICSDGRVNAHKCVLSAATPYFRTALQGPWKENSSSDETVTEWKTSNSMHIMKAVLGFIYTGKLNDSKWIEDYESLNKLLSVASEYQLEALLSKCEQRWIQSLDSPASCKEALCLASLYDLAKLKTACFTYIEENSTTVLLDSDFLSLSKENETLWEELTQELKKEDRRRKRKFPIDQTPSEESQNQRQRR